MPAGPSSSCVCSWGPGPAVWPAYTCHISCSVSLKTPAISSTSLNSALYCFHLAPLTDHSLHDTRLCPVLSFVFLEVSTLSSGVHLQVGRQKQKPLRQSWDVPETVLTKVSGVGYSEDNSRRFPWNVPATVLGATLAFPGTRAGKEPRGCCTKLAARWAPGGHAGNEASQDAGLHTTHGSLS